MIDSGTGQEADLRSLADWLRREPSLRMAQLSLRQADTQPGSMGGWVEAVQMVTDNGWQAASFVLSLMTWRQTRPTGPPVTIRRGDVEVVLTSGDPQEAARIAELLQRTADAAGPEDRNVHGSQGGADGNDTGTDASTEDVGQQP
ncbi:hypothetical protein NMG29_39945 [Streptomyces cocklensis]|uniref:Uncharacterized protein n=1 Tax=Actinacidiphila cocklensis TaxID=887465 RepID=A0A9W4DKQ1_9ACTN|nr:hypothetical protein [Actinacidiphila cocklensis]MDD1064236.1 hypothetical protein [Actinacidiphila cocklensis]CAG6391819.1 conserved hypothetical protein [Actinacidiphila cocklensis]